MNRILSAYQKAIKMIDADIYGDAETFKRKLDTMLLGGRMTDEEFNDLLKRVDEKEASKNPQPEIEPEV